MLDNFRSINLTWDKASGKVYKIVRTSSSDEAGRKLVVQILNDGQVEDLTGATLNLYWETKDKEHNGLDVFDEVDVSKGIFELYFTTGMLSNIGDLNSHLHFFDGQGFITSEPFKITVFKGVDTDAIESSDSFTALTEALIKVDGIQEEFETNEAERQADFEANESKRKSDFEASESERQSTFDDNESSRQSEFDVNEQTRQLNEDVRVSNEQAREAAESDRVTAENTRETQESSRESSESTRESNEDTRISNENARQNAESIRAANESTRQSDEQARETAELNRTSAESTRAENESTRQSNEQSRESTFNDLKTAMENLFGETVTFEEAPTIIAPTSTEEDGVLLRLRREDGSLLSFLGTSADGTGLKLHMFNHDNERSGYILIDEDGTIKENGVPLSTQIKALEERVNSVTISYDEPENPEVGDIWIDLNPLTTRVLADWRMAGNTTEILDYSGNGYHGTIHGNVTIGGSINDGSDFSITGDGTTGYIQTPFNDLQGISNFTIETYLRRNDNRKGWQSLVNNYRNESGGPQGNYLSYRHDNESLDARVSNSNNQRKTAPRMSKNLELGQIYKSVFTYDGSMITHDVYEVGSNGELTEYHHGSASFQGLVNTGMRPLTLLADNNVDTGEFSTFTLGRVRITTQVEGV